MSTTIKNISLYIPHIFANYSKKDVEDVFENLHIGKVNYIDFVAKIGKDGKEYNSAYIHFEYWYNNQVTINFQERVVNPEKEARLVYDDPWHWIVLENNSKKTLPGQRKTCINLGDVTAISSKTECPSTPYKLAKIIPYHNSNPTNLLLEFDECIDVNEEEIEEMEEIYNELKEEDNNLAYFDKRYVQTLEQENYLFRTQIFNLQNAYYLEKMNSSTLVK